MMQQANLAEFRAEQDLRNCGFTPESINAIRATTVITRNGMQHVVPESQQGLNQKLNQTTGATKMEATTASNMEIEFANQQRMFSRFKQFTDNKIMNLESNLSKAIEQIKEMQQTMLTLKSNQSAQINAGAPAKKTRAPSTQAVDRNRVAPSEVQIENIFYCGQR